MNLKTLTWLTLSIFVLRGMENGNQQTAEAKAVIGPPNLDCNQVVDMLNEYTLDNKYACPKGINKPLGVGASAISYLVTREDKSEFVAKTVYSHVGGDVNAQELKKVKLEVITLKRIQSTGSPAPESLIKLHHVVHYNQFTIMVLDAAPRGSLFNFIKQDAEFFMKPGNINLMMAKIASGILWLHGKFNLLHADMKPDNIVVGEDYSPKIIDFDSVQKIGTKGACSGTPIFMAPEILAAGLDPNYHFSWSDKQDVYALGVTFYEMYHAGHPPYYLDSENPDYLELYNEMITYEPWISTTVPPEVKTLMLKCLEIDMNSRISMKDLSAELNQMTKDLKFDPTKTEKIQLPEKTETQTNQLSVVKSEGNNEKLNTEQSHYSTLDWQPPTIHRTSKGELFYSAKSLKENSLGGNLKTSQLQTVDPNDISPELSKEYEDGQKEMFKDLPTSQGNWQILINQENEVNERETNKKNPLNEEEESIIQEKKKNRQKRVLEGEQSPGILQKETSSKTKQPIGQRNQLIEKLSEENFSSNPIKSQTNFHSDAGTPQSSKDGSDKVLFLSGFFVFTVFVLTFLLTRLVKNRKVSVVSPSIDPICTTTIALD